MEHKLSVGNVCMGNYLKRNSLSSKASREERPPYSIHKDISALQRYQNK